MSIQVQAVGECMLEIARTEGGVVLGYAGDTYNTAVYLRRTAMALGVTAMSVTSKSPWIGNVTGLLMF